MGEEPRRGQLIHGNAIAAQKIGQVVLEDGVPRLGAGVGEDRPDTGPEELRDPPLTGRSVMMGGVTGNLASDAVLTNVDVGRQLGKVLLDGQSTEVRLQTGGNIRMVEGPEIEDHTCRTDDSATELTVDENRLERGQMNR